MRQRRYSSLAHYLDAIPTLGCIVSLRSAVGRAHRRAFSRVHALDFGISLKPRAILTSDQAHISRHECLRILACSGLHSKLCSQLFAPASVARAGCSSFASSVLRRVVAKLAAATPEVEAACVVSWCKRAAQDELCQFDDEEAVWHYDITNAPRRQSEYAAAAMLQLAASINGRLALVSCGACETLVHFMLHNQVSSVHGCLYPVVKYRPPCVREYFSDGCNCDDNSYYFHRWYVRAALALEGCASGAYRLNRAGWNRHWHAVEYRGWVKDEVVLELKHRTLMVPLIVLHVITPRGCDCGHHGEGSLCPLEEPAFHEFLQATPRDDQAASEDDEVANKVLSSCLK